MLTSKAVLLLSLTLLITQSCICAADKTPEEVMEHLVHDKSVQLNSCTSPFNIGSCFLEVPHATNKIDLSKPDNLKPGLLSAFKPLLLSQHQRRLKKIDRKRLETHIGALHEALERDDLSEFQRQQLCYKREQLNALRNIVNAAQMEELCIEFLGSEVKDTAKEAVARMQAQGATSHTEEKADLLLEDIISVPKLNDAAYDYDAKTLLKNPKYKFNRQESVCNIGALTLDVFGNSIALSDPTNQKPEILLALKDILLASYQDKLKAMDTLEMINYIAEINLALNTQDLPCYPSKRTLKTYNRRSDLRTKKEQMLALVYIIQEAQGRKTELCLK